MSNPLNPPNRPDVLTFTDSPALAEEEANPTKLYLQSISAFKIYLPNTVEEAETNFETPALYALSAVPVK